MLTAETPEMAGFEDDAELEDCPPGVEEVPVALLRMQKIGSLSKSGISSKTLASSGYFCFDSR